MIELRVVHTADLDADTLNAARALFDDVFVDDPLTEQDWEHCQGGLHALLWHDTELIGHAAVVQRRLTPAGIVRTKDADDYVFVLAVTQPLAVTGALTCDWRDGEVW